MFTKKINQKKFEDVDSEYYDDVSQSEMSECDENLGDSATFTRDELGIKPSDLEINHFFNELPIRILNSHEMPFFYAEDVGKALGIKRLRNSLTNFGEKEIVSQELRRKYEITTYQQCKIGIRRNDKIILLTEFGVYRVILGSRSQVAETFHNFVYDVLYQLRTVGEYRVKAELEELKVVNERQQAELGILKSQMDVLKFKQEAFKNLCDKITLVEIPIDPYEIEPSNLPTSVLKKDAQKLKPKHNRIDNPVSTVYQLSQELGIPTGFVHTHTDMGSDELRIAHNQNKVIAHQFMRDHAPKATYIVTTGANPELLTKGTATHSIYVKDAKYSMGRIRMKLSDHKPSRASSTSAIYTCSREKIIAAMNAVSD